MDTVNPASLHPSFILSGVSTDSVYICNLEPRGDTCGSWGLRRRAGGSARAPTGSLRYLQFQLPIYAQSVSRGRHTGQGSHTGKPL